MGRKPTKYLKTRRKLEWFFENVSGSELQSLPIDFELSGSDLNKRQWNKAGRRLDVSKIKTVLITLASTEGMPIQDRPLRLTNRMLKHVIGEFTSKSNAVETLYGPFGDPGKKRSGSICYTQVLNRALARIEAAFYAAGIFSNHKENRRFEYGRNSFGYLKMEKKNR